MLGSKPNPRPEIPCFFCLPKRGQKREFLSQELGGTKEKGTLRNAWQTPSPPHLLARPPLRRDPLRPTQAYAQGIKGGSILKKT
jgi:hypothetical protein